MPVSHHRDVIGLTVLLPHGSLVVSLTDLGLMARFAHRPSAEAAILALRRDVQDVAECCASGGSESAHTTVHVQELGKRIFELLLPEPVGSAVRSTSARALSLQLDPALAWVPWELAFDGGSFLGHKFQLSRQIVADTPAPSRDVRRRVRGLPRTLIVSGAAPCPQSAATVQRVVTRLRALQEVEVTSVDGSTVAREDLLERIMGSDIVHFVGSFDVGPTCASVTGWTLGDSLIGIDAVAALPAPPALLISQSIMVGAAAASAPANLALAESACRAGLNLLACESGGRGDEGFELIRTVYRQLAQGAALGEAVRAGRSELERRSGIGAVARLEAALYGDGRCCICTNDGRAGIGDNLRQVTILSLDLVGSTRLMATLGAEEYSEILAAYHERCRQIVTGRGGLPDDPQGDDGTMCYFGFPVAREDAANQALRAGLEILDAVRILGVSVRIGISTGQVVVRNGLPHGQAVHFAARLQSIASPDTLLVSESTRRIVKDRFHFEAIENVPQLKGFDQPGLLYRVTGMASAEGTGDGGGRVTSAKLSPFLGRRRELAELEEQWAAVQAGTLRLVRVAGDAGIGKSRLIREFKHALAAKGHAVLECCCTPERMHSAFHPIVAWLRGELRIQEGDSAERVLEKVTQLASPIRVEGAVPLLADLLSVRDAAALDPVLTHSAERRRQLTLEALVALWRRRLESTPVVMIVEDVQWIDHSTGEFLDRLARDAQALPLLLLVSERLTNPATDEAPTQSESGEGNVQQDVPQRWQPSCEVHETLLRGLSPEASRMLVLASSGDVRLPGEVVRELVGKADGVPLFIEESTRMIVEANAGLPAGGLSSASLPVPSLILDLLTARLDRLGDAKRIAQLGGTIGREFSLKLLHAVLAHDSMSFLADDVRIHLGTLVRSGMLVCLGEGDDSRYVFKHALMRDAAYGSLLERNRIRLHRVVASVIGDQFRSLADSQPELLAFHFTQAGMDTEALRGWEAAARQAASRSAQVEAVSHVKNALKVLSRLPADATRDRMELRLQLLLATRLIATEGYGADRVERVYARAMELATALGDDTALMKVSLGLEGYHFMRGDFDKAHAIAVDAQIRAQNSADTITRAQLKWAVANIVMHRGEMEEAVQQMDACRVECDRIVHRPGAVQDPGVMCLCYSAWALWQLGFPDEALERTTAVVARSEQLNHKFSMGEAYGFQAAVQHFRGENVAALASAERAIAICEEGGFAVWLAHARLIRGRALTEVGDIVTGIDEMQVAYDDWTRSGAVVTTPFYLALRAEGLVLAERPEEALNLLEQALAIIERSGERYYEAEIRRLYGQLMLHAAGPSAIERRNEAAVWLLDAHSCARSRNMRSLALRCAIALADLYLAQHRGREAVEILEPAYRSIKGGAGTRDLIRASELLQLLRAGGTVH